MQYLEKAASIYVANARANTEKLKQVELLIFILTLVTLCFEALFIFKPANKKSPNTQEIIRQKIAQTPLSNQVLMPL